MTIDAEKLRALIAGAELPAIEVEDDYRPGMSGNRHIVYNDGADRFCFMAHSAGRFPDRDAARAQLVATGLSALPELLDQHEADQRRIAKLMAGLRELARDAGEEGSTAGGGWQLYSDSVAYARALIAEVEAES